MELYSPAMVILWLVFLLTSAILLLLVFAVSFKGNERLAWRIVKAWGASAGTYGAILLIAAMLPRTSVLKTGLPYCDDDLCMTVVNMSQEPAPDGATRKRIDVRLSSRANHGTRNARGSAVYLTDDSHRRFPLVDAFPAPFDADVDPGRSVSTTLTFDVPADARRLYFEIRMEQITFASLITGVAPWQPLLKLAIG